MTNQLTFASIKFNNLFGWFIKIEYLIALDRRTFLRQEVRLNLPCRIHVKFAAGEFHLRFVQANVVDRLPHQVGDIDEYVEVVRRKLSGWILSIEVNHAKRRSAKRTRWPT